MLVLTLLDDEDIIIKIPPSTEPRVCRIIAKRKTAKNSRASRIAFDFPPEIVIVRGVLERGTKRQPFAPDTINHEAQRKKKPQA